MGDKSDDLKDGGDTAMVQSSSSSEEPERGYWGKQAEFILSCIGYAVGLGNLWRFPYLCMRNGGGAFLIPYFFFLFLCGIPLFFMELVLGQFTSLSPLGIWNMAPLFKGLGYGMVIVSGILCIYYNVIITWVLFFLFSSFTSELAWGTSGNWWNIVPCDRNASNFTYEINSTNCSNSTASLSEQYWHGRVLRMTKGIDDFGGLNWELVGCLVLAWVIVFGCLFKGVKSSGKVVYVTATVPYIFLTILMVRGVLLPGAINGIIFYLTPDWERMFTFEVWCEACLQIFYSLGPAWGGLITMASYNKFNNNCYRDAVLVPIVNCGTSFYAGFVIFSIIGYMAQENGVPIEKAIKQGPGLAFVAYPEAITKLPISPLWAILFFLMLLTLGLDSQFATFETVVSSFVDEWPKILRKRKLLFTLILIVIEFCIGLLYVSKAGMYWFQVTDWYCAAFSVVTIAFCECIVVSYLYGAERLYYEIEMMIGFRPFFWWKICWMFITPLLLFSVIVFTLVTMTAPKYGEYQYPDWGIGFGWFMASLSLIPFPLVAIYRIYHTPGSLIERLRILTRPTADWGPALAIHRENYKYNQKPLGMNQELLPTTGPNNDFIDNPGNPYVDNKPFTQP